MGGVSSAVGCVVFVVESLVCAVGGYAGAVVDGIVQPHSVLLLSYVDYVGGMEKSDSEEAGAW